MNRTTLGLVFTLCAATFACSSEKSVNIGEDHPAASGQALVDYAASWDGYAEAHQFESGSDRIRITLDASGEGWVEFGDVPLLPPPTDPDVGYVKTHGSSKPTLHEGLLYPVHGVTLQSARLELGVDLSEPLEAWCELQTPVMHEGSGVAPYGCAPSVATTFDNWTTCTLDDAGDTIDCDKFWLCGGPACTCDSTSCTTDVKTSLDDLDHRLDAALENEGDSLVGTFVLDDDQRVTVRLARP